MKRSGYRVMARTIFGACAALAQTAPLPPQTAPPPPQAPAKPPAEMATHDEPAMFKARVNLVVVPVVVRDRKGNAVGSFKQEDFQLFDKGKPQFIARFSVEKVAGRLEKAAVAPVPSPDKPSEDKPAVDLPDRFIAYLFDDVHMKFGDLARSRDAAGRHIDSALRTTDRAAIYTTSGQTEQDFTDDRSLLHEALGKLRMHPVTGQGLNRCPNMTYYMADLIVNKNDAITLN